MERSNLDRWLNDAVAEFGKAEPRAGLEQRLLAKVHEEQQHMSAQRWRAALAVMGGVAIAVFVVWLAGVATHRRPTPSLVISSSAQRLNQRTPGSMPAQTQNHTAKLVNKMLKQRGQSRTGRRAGENASAPRLDQFPSARGLSHQEELLLMYVRESPKTEIIAAEKQLHEISDLEIKDIVVPALDAENATSESSQSR